jgi:two-component system response regulator (stage 0 sporulation protein F)
MNQAFVSRRSVRKQQAGRVVVAEDDMEQRTLLTRALKKDGFIVIEVRSGTELVDFLAGLMQPDGTIAGVDLIVSDIRMPGYTALDVLAGLRFALHTTPVILVTAFGDEATHRLALALGAIAVFDKPFDIDDLRMAVINALNRKGT